MGLARFPFHQCFLAAIFIGLLGITASAEVDKPIDITELSIDELINVEVISASKFPQKISEAPASVSIVTAADIKAFGYHTLADILRSMRGIDISYDRNFTYVGVRGLNRPGDYDARILLLLDGYRVNDAVYDQAMVDRIFAVDMNLIDRVEVVRGPGSSIYGNSAFFAVVNVITKHGRDLKGGEASAEAGGWGSRTGQLSYGRQFENGVDLLLSASDYDSKGQDFYYPAFDAPATNNGFAQNLDRETARHAYGKLAFGDFTVESAYSERLKWVPTASFGTAFNDPRFVITDAESFFNFGYNTALSESQDLSARVSYNHYNYSGIYPYGPAPIVLNLDEFWADYIVADVKLVSRHNEHKIVYGAELQNNFQQNQKNFNVSPFKSYLDTNNSDVREALYLQDEITLLQNLMFNAGLRYDYFSTFGAVVNPRLALIYNPAPDTTLKLLYGNAFRAPNAYEQYYSSVPLGIMRNPDLKPERIASYEFVVEQQLRPNFRLTASAYYNQINNMLNQVTDPMSNQLVFQNIGQVTGRGAELEAERALSDGTRLRASYAWQFSQDQITGQELTNSPRHLGKLNYSVPMFDGAARTGLELQYTGGRKTLAGDNAGDYWLANLILTELKLARGLELNAAAYNLFDRRYYDPGRPEHTMDMIQQDGTNLMVKLIYHF